MTEVFSYHLGTIDYNRAYLHQLRCHHFCFEDLQKRSILLGCEHPPTVTIGKNGSDKWIRSLPEGLELIQSDRGGEVTAHEPGQLVVYFIFNLATIKLGVKNFIHTLETSIISLLSNYGISAYRDADYPGVWVNGKKICALGVRVKNRITLHGLALNLSNSLELFSHIIPCGIEDRGVCRVQDFVEMVPSGPEIWNNLLKILGEIWTIHKLPPDLEANLIGLDIARK